MIQKIRELYDESGRVIGHADGGSEWEHPLRVEVDTLTE